MSFSLRALLMALSVAASDAGACASVVPPDDLAAGLVASVGTTTVSREGGKSLVTTIGSIKNNSTVCAKEGPNKSARSVG